MKKVLFLSTLMLAVWNCSDKDDEGQINCTTIACTENFVSFSVSVRDTSDMPVALDEFEVRDATTGEDLTRNIDEAALAVLRLAGTYPLYDDLFVAGNQNTSREIVFKGFIGDQEVANAVYTVAADCCHVSLVSGNLDIVIN